MNQGIYKLVYSKVLNMYVPASEAVPNNGGKSARRVRKHSKNSLRYIFVGYFIFSGNVWAEGPTGLVPGTQAWINATITGATSNSLTITQTKPKAILDWQKLNLSAGELLRFDQQGNRTWSALNRIHDLNPSILDGTVLADGNVYFINTNGIIFGNNAQFNVGSMYAGTLDITDELFNKGFVNDTTFTKVFEGVGGFVTVEKGAQINTASGGKVLLFAPTVTNNGVINTPDGQTILAAGNKVYLQSSKDPAGFLVEVDSGGTATNLGKIVAERGNITMMGLAVNQAGTLTATTSVRANGSIKLLAQDKASVSGVDVIGARDGLVTLTKDSITEVTPEYANKEETIASQPFSTSDIKIEGSLVNIEGTVSAKGGNVIVEALNPVSASLASENPNGLTSRIHLGENATIDVSGVDAVAPMSRNQLEIQLFSDQLKDAPILRDSGLFKDTVYVDARKGTQLFDIQPFLALKGATVAEKMTKAGTIKLATPNDLIAEKGSVMNVSGGSTTYETGTIKETNLYYNGKLVPISEAKPGVPYDKSADLYTVKDAKWGVTRSWDLSGGGTQNWGKTTTGLTENQLKATVVGSQIAGYLEGDDAGKLDLTVSDDKVVTQNLVLAGQLLANTKSGLQQKIDQAIPEGGKLIASANDLLIAKNANELAEGFGFSQKLAENFQSSIRTDLLAQGFNDIDLAKVNTLKVDDAMHLNPNGVLVLNRDGDTNRTLVNANIYAPSSNIRLGGEATIADGVTISTAGTFTNDSTGSSGQYTRPVAINGNSAKEASDGRGKKDPIKGIVATSLKLGKNVTLDTSAGAWVDNAGKLHEGEAGNIAFTTSSTIDDSVKLQAYGFKKNGELSIAFITPANLNEQTVNIGNSTTASVGDIDIAPAFFNSGAFSKYELSAFKINLGDSVGVPQEIYAQQKNWKMDAGFLNQAGGQPMGMVATPFLQPELTRAPVSLGFTASKLGGMVTLAENMALRTDRGGSVSLAAGKQVNVLGDISTPSGNISISINDKDATLPYDATQAIYIGESASLSASGSSVALPDSRSEQLKTEVFKAGKISIDAPKGAVVFKEGAVLDVSGASVVNDTQTLTGITRETLYGDAGTIKVSASDGLLLDGTFIGAAEGSGRDGTLEVGFTDSILDGGGAALTGNREFTITQHKKLATQNFVLGDTLKTSSDGEYVPGGTDTLNAQISAEQVKQGGFANLKVKSFLGSASTGVKDSILLADGLDLQVPGNLKLESPVIAVKNDGSANISASHITLRSPSVSVDKAVLTAGNGKLTTQSKQLNIDGLVAVEGVKETSLNADLDISGKGTQVKSGSLAATQGGIVANGDIHLKARQIYPATNAKLGFESVGDNGKITVDSSGAAAKPVLSAGGVLSLTADEVTQKGVLTAPFGQIEINAKNSATFAAGSVTSVSANSQNIPYGTTDVGGEIFNPDAGKTTPLPDKAITIKSKNVDLQKDAVVDLSAGGDMFAYEWVPGIGGSQDVLAKPNTYAVIPNLGQDYAPFDQGYSESSALVGVGQSVYLTGVPGLASGTYTLLPARYALVPGAFMVEANVAGSKLLPKQAIPQLDGTTLTTGYFADLGTGSHDAAWSTFKVTNGAIFRPETAAVSKSPSQYLLTNANTFFSNPLKTNGQDVSRPMDVAKLGLDATKLNLEASVVANKQTGGEGLQVDISSQNIRVVNNIGADDGSLQLTAGSLNALNAESLLLGGSRTLSNGVDRIITGAETVSIENNNSNVVNTPEFIATANDKVTVKTDAIIDTGTASKTPAKKVMESGGDGALFALSSKSDISYSRTGGSPTSVKGELNIEANSTLKAGNSVVLDATKSAKLGSAVVLQDGGSATLGANRILIGDAPADTVGLNVNAAAFAALGQLKALTLNSYNNIDTYGSINFGNDKLNLTMNAAGIVGHLADGETATTVPANATSSVINANKFTLKNTQDAKFNAPTDSSGRVLTINATTVKFDGETNPTLVNNQLQDNDKTTISGFTRLDVNADEVRVANVGELNLNVAETKLTTGRVTADTAADYKIKTADKLEIAQLANAEPANEKGFGAKLDIQAKDLVAGGTVELSSGKLSLTATNDLNITSGAKVSATSTANTFYTKTVDAPAGSITLASNAGNVNVNAGATVDVTSQGEANAGLVKVVAMAGTANIAGDLKGSAAGTGKGGSLDVEVKTLTDLSATNNKAVGFSESRQYRVRTGDVNITGTGLSALAARETMVSADTGKITVTGEIVANAPKNSHIGLFAGNGVTLESTAKLEAKSTKAGEEGGKVQIFTNAGTLDAKSGSSIDVSGGTGGAGGKVHFRTPRTGAGTGNGVAVSNIATTIAGAQSTVLEAFRVFSGVDTIAAGTGAGATLGYADIANDAGSFMANKDSILASLGKSGDTSFHLRAGAEVRSAGNLTVGSTTSDWDLSSLRAGGEPGILTLRANGNIKLDGTLSDGFTNATLSGATAGNVLDGDSWTYRIVAGADYISADVLDTVAATSPTTGNVILASNKGIRTGTGDIDIAAGGDLKMAGPNAVIYTAGRNAESLEGFDAAAATLKPVYLSDGGDISITTQGNIVGAESSTNNRQLVNQWLFRQGGGTQIKDASWWVRPDLFKQSLATLGGGDVSINAGGSITNFSAAAPTTARFDTNGNSGNKVIDGGGDVKVNAIGDITNGVYFVAKGDGDIMSGGKIQKQGSFGTVLALQDGAFNVSARGDNFIEAVINPTLVNQSTTNAGAIDKTGTNAYFNTYSEQAKVKAESLNGDLQFEGGSNISSNVSGLTSAASETLKYAPGQISLAAHNGDIGIGDLVLMPSLMGDLKGLASGEVKLANLTMSDADVATLPSVNKPVDQGFINSANLGKAVLVHGAKPLNTSDPVIIVAQNGSIDKQVAANDTVVVLSKAGKLVAGKDIKNIKLVIQNQNSSDISVIKADNDVAMGYATVGGAGELLVQAGRNIDLTNTNADISTTGNSGNSAAVFNDTLGNRGALAIANPNLPKDGTSITLQAGVGKGANVQGYIDQYILLTGAGPVALVGNPTKLAEYRATTSAAVTSYMRKTTGDNMLSDADALTQFNALNLEAKTIFANRHLTSELIASAQDFVKTGNHDRGKSAISTLFPTLNPGNILLYASKVSTNSGGSIDLLAPGGFINVGSPGKAFKDTFTNTGDIGVITEQGGEIRAIADGDFQVNQSKLITQFGSDIAIWSTNGTIDAGRGSKTATSIPERIVLTDADGNTTIEVKGVAAGSGIRAQTYDPDGPNGPRKAPKKGTVYLTAPKVDAGEAGIEAGDLFIVAPIVLNAANIQVSGASSGVPVAATSSVAGVTAGVSPDSVNSAAAAVAQSVANSANQPFVKPTLPSIISVDVISIGD